MPKRKRETKTPTQLRNARKRKAKKREKATARLQDPSLVYIDDPLSAPTVLQAKHFFKELGQRLPLQLKAKEGWRSSAKLAVRRGADGLKIGLFLPKSHEIISVLGCSAYHPAINQALEAITVIGASGKIKGYDELDGTGDLRYVKLDVERSTELVQVTLVWNASSQEEAGSSLSWLLKKLKRHELWHSIWLNFNAADKHTSRILAYEKEAWLQVHGPKRFLREALHSVEGEAVELCFPPFVFRQANLCAFEDIVSLARHFVPAQSVVVELYGGVGTIGLHLADRVSSLVCSDENPHNRLCFKRSAKALPEELRPHLSYVQGDAASQVKSVPTADVVIVDPPRKGLDEAVLQALCRSRKKKQQRLIYVSCGFPAFQRDCQKLIDAGWTVHHAEGFILFPGADHLETFCVFDRA